MICSTMLRKRKPNDSRVMRRKKVRVDHRNGHLKIILNILN